MVCPKCKSEKVRVNDTVHTPDNEIYRERKCDCCGYVFYTTEFQVEVNEKFEDEWYMYHRNRRRKR